MLAIAWLLRIFSYLFHFVLSLALLALGCVAVLSGAQNLKLEVVPWHGRELNHFLLLAGLVGLLSVILAMTGKFPYLFPLWSLAVVVMLVRGVFLSPAFTFTGPDQFKNALWLAAGALAAFAGSLTVFRRRERSPGPSRP